MGLYGRLVRSVSTYVKRTHTCGELRGSHAGEKVRLQGWVQNSRLSNKFLVLRDSFGSVQLRIEGMQDLNVTVESVMDISGIVEPRPCGQENPNLATGDVEIRVDAINGVYPAKSGLPFSFPRPGDKRVASEHLRLKYRHLDIRTNIVKALKFRSDLVHGMRNFFIKNGFVDVETPTLFRRTPGGAAEFIVPSSALPGKFYSLIQSPQQFKQLLMIGGVDRYFQIARCYRDESCRSDRQPEFTQVDVEMSFVDRKGVKNLIEDLIIETWPYESIPLSKEDFPVITYEEAMKDYGTDKPDIRFESKILDVTPILKNLPRTKFKFLDNSLKNKEGYSVLAIKFEGIDERTKVDKAFLKNLEEEVIKRFSLKDRGSILSQYSLSVGLELQSSLHNKVSEETEKALIAFLDLKPHDFGYFIMGNSEVDREAIGVMRLELGKAFCDIDPFNFKFLWVQDFPLFFPTNTGYEPAHHPFTQPHPEDEHLLKSEPFKVRSLHYDLVLNGFEIAGGSIRIHNSDLQSDILKNFLKEDSISQLSHLIEALGQGCPPHGGIAIGLDRYVSCLLGAKSIREVIAFPKSSSGRDLMCDSPCDLTEEEKARYFAPLIKTKI